MPNGCVSDVSARPSTNSAPTSTSANTDNLRNFISSECQNVARQDKPSRGGSWAVYQNLVGEFGPPLHRQILLVGGESRSAPCPLRTSFRAALRRRPCNEERRPNGPARPWPRKNRRRSSDRR